MSRRVLVAAAASLSLLAVSLAVVADPPDEGREARTFSPEPRSPHVGGHLTTGDPRSPVVMPPQRIDLEFSHETHVKGADLPCSTCHESVETSTTTKDLNVPPKTACLDCHDAEEIPAEWGRDVKKGAIDMPPAHLNFSHRTHLAVEGVTCGDCHAGVADADLATVEHLPSMETCIGCHAEKGAPTDCRTCHAQGRGGTIRTEYPSGMLLPDDHGTLWQEQHGAAAEADMGLCASCHAQTDCLSCHDGAVPPTFHESNYLALHPQDAMANSPQCASCHRLERFCRDCHFRAEVTLGNPLIAGVTGSFHPSDWLIPGQSDFHGNVARKNLASCSSCHAQQDCLSCHAFSTGAPRIHPPGWAGSRRMRQLRDANFGMCLQCHGFGDPADPIQIP